MLQELLLCTILTASNISHMCMPDKPFVWCDRKGGKSDTKPFQCRGGKGVSMHLYHHATGCNGAMTGIYNYFRGSKSENLMEWSKLEKLAMPNATTCSVIDATGFTIIPCIKQSDIDLCEGAMPLCGMGEINFYKGIRKGEYCKVHTKIGSYTIDDIMTKITIPQEEIIYRDHKKVKVTKRNEDL